MADFKSPENLKALLEALQDTKDAEVADKAMKNLVEKSTRRSSKAGDLFKMVGDAVGESYNQGYKPNFTMGAEGVGLPVKATPSGSTQLVPTSSIDDIVETTGKVLSKKATGKEVAKNLLKKGLSKGALGSLAVAGEVLGAEQVNPEDDTKNPVIADLLRENEIAKMSDDPEKQKLIAEFLNQSQYGMPESPSEKLMQATKLKSEGKDVNASPEEFAKSITREADATQENIPPSPEEQPDEVQQMAEAISTKPSDVVNQLKSEVSQKKVEEPKEEVNMVAQLQKDLEDYKKLSESKVKDAKTVDLITNIGNRIQDAMSYLRQSRAAKGAGRMMDRMVPTAQAEDALSKTLAENKTNYAQLKDKLAMAQAEQDKILGIKEKEKDRQLQRDVAQAKLSQKDQLTEGQKALDKAYAKEYSDYVASGGAKQIESTVDRLDELVNEVKENKDIFSGAIDKATEFIGSDALRSITNPRLQDLKSRFEQIVQQDLRETLGAQFTEKEAEQFMARAFDPKLSADANVKRMEDMLSQVKNKAEQRKRASEYFEKEGSLKGFKGNLDSAPKTEKTENKSMELADNEVVRTTPDGRKIVYDKNTKQPLREIK